jgi:hypothetical protein
VITNYGSGNPKLTLKKASWTCQVTLQDRAERKKKKLPMQYKTQDCV